MIRRIVFVSILFCLFIAIVLATFDITQVRMGAPMLSFLRQCYNSLEEFKIEIPDIPFIPHTQDVGGFWVVINVIVDFFNAIIKIINILVDLINIIISLIQFIVIMFGNFDSLIETLKASVVSGSVA